MLPFYQTPIPSGYVHSDTNYFSERHGPEGTEKIVSLPVASGISSFAWRIRLIKEVIQHETQSSSSIQSFGNTYEITHFFMHRRVKTENEPSLLCHFATYSRKGKKAVQQAERIL